MDIICHDGNLIQHAEKKLAVFHCIDVVKRYDCVNPPDPITITRKDIELANIMGARLGEKYWHGLIGRDISSIPYNVDLISMDNRNWNLCKQVIKKPIQDLLKVPGIACPKLTKVIHRKRPNLIPVCDTVIVEDILGAKADKKDANTIILIMDKLRDVGQKNMQTLQQIRNFLVDKNKLSDLSNLRMLEILYWMEKTDRYISLFVIIKKNQWWV